MNVQDLNGVQMVTMTHPTTMGPNKDNIVEV